MFGRKNVAAPAAATKEAWAAGLNSAAFSALVKEINEMRQSANYSMIYGAICFAFELGLFSDYELITIEQRQALGEMLRAQTAALKEQEQAQKEAERIERQKKIAEYEAERKAKAKAAKAKMAEGAK